MSIGGSYGGQYGGEGVPPLAPTPSGRRGNGPSRNVLRNVIFVIRNVPGTDADGSPLFTPTTIFANLPCSVQPGESTREERHGAPRQITQYRILIGANPGVLVGDQIQWTDDLGVLRIITVVGLKSLAGRGAAFYVYGEEVI